MSAELVPFAGYVMCACGRAVATIAIPGRMACSTCASQPAPVAVADDVPREPDPQPLDAVIEQLIGAAP